MVFDKVIVLIEHQANELFSVYHRKSSGNYWHCLFINYTFDQAKQWVKLIKVAYEIAENKPLIEIYKLIMDLEKFITDNQLNGKRLTAGKLYKLYISQNGSL